MFCGHQAAAAAAAADALAWWPNKRMPTVMAYGSK
jgi:hypothetical protein